MPMPDNAAAVLPWVVRGRLAARRKTFDAEAWMVANRAPDAAVRVIKSPVGAGSTDDLGADYTNAVRAFVESLRPQSALVRLVLDNAVRRIPLRTRAYVTATPAVAVMVEEGQAKPLSALSLHNVTIAPVKAIAAFACTNELWRDLTPAGQVAFRNELAGAVATAIDAAWLSMLTDASTISFGSSGATAVDARSDLMQALLATSPGTAARFYWIAAIDVARRAAALATSTGAAAFPEMAASGSGELAGCPVVISAGAPAGTLTLVDGAGVVADVGTVDVRESTQADMLLSDDPSSMNATSPAGASMTSLWQSQAVGILAECVFGSEKLNSTCVCQITDIAWGGA